MFEISFSRKSRKSLKRLSKSGQFDERSVSDVIRTLATGKSLEARHQNHTLHGEYADCFECHIKNDLLLIYKIHEEKRLLSIVDIGSHSDLFEWVGRN
ncbi:MAG: type II toxin-antitoxin system mRNA interferase toxin, RelE/StbE family [Patescibacteria group bacterium]